MKPALQGIRVLDLTNVLALEPGDVVATGTHHVQLSPIQDGDRVRLSIQGLGPALRTLEMALPEGVTILARFAPSVAGRAASTSA